MHCELGGAGRVAVSRGKKYPQSFPLTATAGLVWNRDLPRPLQQILFDTAYGATSPAPASLSRAG